MQLTIESVKTAKSGKSLVIMAGGKQYLAKKESGIGAGMTIDAETKDSEFNGALLTWIEKWRPINAAPQASPSVARADSESGSAARLAVAAPVWLPFASNTVAHAITAGYIKEPGQVSMWAKAAKEAYEALT